MLFLAQKISGGPSQAGGWVGGGPKNKKRYKYKVLGMEYENQMRFRGFLRFGDEAISVLFEENKCEKGTSIYIYNWGVSMKKAIM